MLRANAALQAQSALRRVGTRDLLADNGARDIQRMAASPLGVYAKRSSSIKIKTCRRDDGGLLKIPKRSRSVYAPRRGDFDSFKCKDGVSYSECAAHCYRLGMVLSHLTHLATIL